MGYGMGKLEIIDHDGKGDLTLRGAPVRRHGDHAFVDLGQVSKQIGSQVGQVSTSSAVVARPVAVAHKPVTRARVWATAPATPTPTR